MTRFVVCLACLVPVLFATSPARAQPPAPDPAPEATDETSPEAPTPEADTDTDTVEETGDQAPAEVTPDEEDAEDDEADDDSEDDEASTDDGAPDFWSLRTPDSPAFVVLGVSPSEVQRPTTTRDVAIALRDNFFRDGEVGLPDSFALEVAPYWLADHSELTLQEYSEQTLWSFAQNFTLSLAATSDEREDEMTGETIQRSFLSIGARTTLLENRDPAGCPGELDREFETIAARLNEDIAQRVQQKVIELGRPPTREELAEIREAAYDAREDDVESLRRLAVECQKAIERREGVAIDLAAGAAWVVEDEESARFSQGAVWLTGGHTWTNFAAVVMARYRAEDIETDATRKLLDGGLRLVFAFDRYAISAEGVARHRLDAPDGADDWLFRVAIAGDVRINDNVWVNLTFGRDFPDEEASELLALANLQIEFGDRRVQNPADALEPSE